MSKPNTILSGGKPPAGRVVGKTSEGRPIVQNADGSVSTERTITIEMDDGYMNIPTMFGGKQVTPREAIDIIRKHKGVDPETGKKLDIHKSIPDAEAAAQERSRKLGEEIRQLFETPEPNY